jgi:hypothetical protein
MAEIIIAPTENTPAIHFLESGKLKMEGRCYPEDVVDFFTPLIQWARVSTITDIDFKINLEYFNSGSTKILFDLLKTLDNNKNLRSLRIEWHVDENDEDSLTTAETYSEKLQHTDFKLIKYVS